MIIAPLNERDGELKSNWYIAALSFQVTKTKPFKSIIYDTDLVLFRTSANEIVCLVDRCVHRHAQLSLGTIENDHLTCPYHGWTYDKTGTVVSVPSEGTEKKSKSNFCQKKFYTFEQDDCVWVWMGENAPSSPPPYRFPNWKQPGWVSYFMITDFDNEVTHLAENFMDVPHTVFVHAGWFRNKSLTKVKIDVETKNGEVNVTYIQPNDTIGFTGRILNPRNEPLTHTDRFIMPNITRVDYNFGSKRSFIINSQITPTGTLKSRVYTAIIYRVGILSVPLKPFFQFYTRQVINQDVEIMANQGYNFEKDFSCHFKATDADVVHSAIEKLRMLGQKMNSNYKEIDSTIQKDIWI